MNGNSTAGRLADLLEQEEGRFVEDHPGSQRLFERGEKALLGGVPMPWMTEWASPFPIFAADAEGARFEDVDGNEYVDLCLGDTGAMTGHSPEPTVKAVADRAVSRDHADAADRGRELGGG